MSKLECTRTPNGCQRDHCDEECWRNNNTATNHNCCNDNNTSMKVLQRWRCKNYDCVMDIGRMFLCKRF